jgi:N-acetylmuramoyl-L-alanine amidase
MDNDLRRRRARQERIRRRKRQIRFRLALIGISILLLVTLVIATKAGKAKIAAFGTEVEAQTPLKSETDQNSTEDAESDDNEEIEDTEQPDDAEEADAEEADTDIRGIDGAENWTVILDAGHGGKDQGCAYGEVLEKDINLNVVLLLEEKLKQSGVNVIMTRSDDTFVYLNRRVAAAENAEADAFISIHVDSYEDDSSINGLTIHCEEGADGGKVFADKIHEILSDADITHVRNVMESDLYVLRNTTMPAVLIEVGFLTNSTDRANLQSETFLEELSDGIYEGIIDYLTENEKNW